MLLTDITHDGCSALSLVEGTNRRKGYENSAEGRAAFAAECAEAENYQDVWAAWGEAPTVTPMQPGASAPGRAEINAANIDFIAMLCDIDLEG